MSTDFKRLVMIVSTFLLFFCTDSKASATSWAELEPQEVISRSEVVVVGTYDFEGEAIFSSGIFTGFLFNVDAVYKGEAVKRMIVGIDQYDIGWVQEYQDGGGEFLLFLQEQDDANFLVPVAGPNGMIQIKDGKVKGGKTAVYEDFLAAHASKAPSGDADTLNSSEGISQMKTDFMVYGVFVIFFMMIGYFIYRKRHE